MLKTDQDCFRLLAQPMAVTGKSPVWDDQRHCLWWVDIQSQKLLKTQECGETDVVAIPSQPGFVALADSGCLVLGLENGLWTYVPESERWQQQSTTESDRPLVRLNDGKADAQGRLWFGSMDMTHQGLTKGKLYRRDPAGDISIVREGIQIPNAIVPCGNGRNLLFTDTPTGVIELMDLDPESGQVIGSKAILQADDGCTFDSACVDAAGTFWVGVVGSGEVVNFASSGRILGRYPSPISRATAVALGGREGKTLFLTNQRRFLTPHELA